MTDDVARTLFIKDGNPAHLWASADYGTQLHYRLEAERMDKPSEMVERVAKTIYHGQPRNKPWQKLPAEFQRRYHNIARDVIREMREPGFPIRKITTFEFAEVEWPKLIDAALSS